LGAAEEAREYNEAKQMVWLRFLPLGSGMRLFECLSLLSDD
jgi:hypothetical protein